MISGSQHSVPAHPFSSEKLYRRVQMVLISRTVQQGVLAVYQAA